MRDVILAIRADEAHHRVVNHTLSSIHLDDPNPFHPGQRKLQNARGEPGASFAKDWWWMFDINTSMDKCLDETNTSL